MLTYNSENFSDVTNNELSTPSSKRGVDALSDMVDQSSTSKKLYSPVNSENGDDEIITNVMVEKDDEVKVISEDADLLIEGVVKESEQQISKANGSTKVKKERYKY